VKRRDLLRHLAHHGCAFLREGANHTLYINRAAKKVSTIPGTTRSTGTSPGKICKDHQVPPGLQRAKMADRLPPLSWPRQQGKRRCGSCGKLYVGRPREETVCLTCDIRERTARGEHPATIAVRFGISRFLIEAVLEGDSHPTRTPRRSMFVDSGRPWSP
jgi:hypothetical protein